MFNTGWLVFSWPDMDGATMKLDKKYLHKHYSNCFNYTGSKHRYLEALFSVLPDDEHLTVIDPFVGGGDLISKLPTTWSIFASDEMPQLIGMHKEIQCGFLDTESVSRIVNEACLNSSSEHEYYMFRARYNDIGHQRPGDLYALLCHSNSNRIRFSPNGFNMPFGKRTFNKDMQAKLDNYSELLSKLTIDFSCNKYTDIDFNKADLLLIDPPYLNTTATYNESGAWTINDEFELLTKINQSVKNGVKFVYFGQLWSKGVNNPHLEAWAKQFNVKVLNDTTSHCSSNRKGGKTIEVMIYN